MLLYTLCPVMTGAGMGHVLLSRTLTIVRRTFCWPLSQFSVIFKAQFSVYPCLRYACHVFCFLLSSRSKCIQANCCSLLRDL